MTTSPAPLVKVRVLVPLGGNLYGAVIMLPDTPLGNDVVPIPGVSTLVDAYVAAGYVERVYS